MLPPPLSSPPPADLVRCRSSPRLRRHHPVAVPVPVIASLTATCLAERQALFTTSYLPTITTPPRSAGTPSHPATPPPGPASLRRRGWPGARSDWLRHERRVSVTTATSGRVTRFCWRRVGCGIPVATDRLRVNGVADAEKMPNPAARVRVSEDGIDAASAPHRRGASSRAALVRGRSHESSAVWCATRGHEGAHRRGRHVAWATARSDGGGSPISGLLPLPRSPSHGIACSISSPSRLHVSPGDAALARARRSSGSPPPSSALAVGLQPPPPRRTPSTTRAATPAHYHTESYGQQTAHAAFTGIIVRRLFARNVITAPMTLCGCCSEPATPDPVHLRPR